MNKFMLNMVAISLLSSSMIAGVKKVEITPMIGKKLYNYSDDSPRFDDGQVVFGGRANIYFNDTVSLQLGAEGSKDNPIAKPGHVGATTDLLRGMVSIQKDIPNRSRVTPYFFAGLGGEKVYNDVPETNVDSQMFYNGGAGLRYSVNPKVDLVGEARVIHKVEDEDTDIIGNVGVGFKFGRATTSSKPVKSIHDLVPPKPEPKPQVVEPIVMPAEPEPAPVVEPIIIDSKEAAVGDVMSDDGCAPQDITGSCPSDRDSGSVGVSSGYYIQVISLRKNSTDKVTSKLDRMGLSYTFEEAGANTRVLVGPYASKSAARRALSKAKRVSRDAFIVSR